LEDIEIEIKKAIDANGKNGSSNEMEIEALKQEVANFNFANKSTTRAFVKSDSGKNKDYTDKSELVSLHGKLIKGQIKARASERRWRVLISQCKQYRVISSSTLAPSIFILPLSLCRILKVAIRTKLKRIGA
jgi:hypothetical protein